MKTSFPKDKINVLLLENTHPVSVERFRQEGFTVTHLQHSLAEEDLCAAITDVHILGIRSKTLVTPMVLQKASALWAIGVFCIGTNQIDLAACDQHGVGVFNAPYSNTRSVVELVIGQMIALIRQLPVRSQQVHRGIWQKSAASAFEIRGKTLGIVGYGNIGAQLSVLAESLGMQVYYYDLQEKLALGNAKKCESLIELLGLADVISLHVDGREENQHLIDAKALASMREGSILINLSRGHVVDLSALAVALRDKHLLGAAIDVYPEEPKGQTDTFRCPLQNCPNVILTPHIGGSTQEAQRNIGEFVPQQVIQYMNTGSSMMTVNLPELQLPMLKNSPRVIHLPHNAPGVLAKINDVFARQQINVVGQYLKTTQTIGYVITDIIKDYPRSIVTTLKAIEGTIRVRVLY